MNNNLTMSSFMNNIPNSRPYTGVIPAVSKANGKANIEQNANNAIKQDVQNDAQSAKTISAQDQNIGVSQHIKTVPQTATESALSKNPSADTVELNKTFKKAKKKNGLAEKLYDKAKNITGLGLSSNKVQKIIDESGQGLKNEKDAKDAINNYRESQEKFAQTAGDAISILAGAGTFFGLKKAAGYGHAYLSINEEHYAKGSFNRAVEVMNNISQHLRKKDLIKHTPAKLVAHTKDFLGNNKKMTAVAAIIAALAGGISKNYALKLDRIGTKQYKLNKEEKKEFPRSERHKEEKALKKAKKKDNRRNFWSGMLNGALSPLMTLPLAVGTPLYLGANALSRYFIGERNNEEKKTLKGFKDSITNSPILVAAGTILTAIPLIKMGKAGKIFAQNMPIVAKNLTENKLAIPDFGDAIYTQLEKILLGDESINKIIGWGSRLSNEEKVLALTNENIFAVKFKQIQEDSHDSITAILKETCPPSRTMDQAQVIIEKTFGNQYSVEKCLGVGTVAESYLAKDNSTGAEVCIKMLKDGITKEKVQADGQKFIEIVKNALKKQNASEDEINYMVRNVENIANGVLQEVDFNNEMEAAKKLAKYTKAAKVVKPIMVKDGLYVMEKADGISLDSLTKLNELFTKQKIAQERVAKHPDDKKFKERLDDINKKIEQVKAKTPAFGDISLDKKTAKRLIAEYRKVLVEQFNKTNKNGKTIHADIHQGNIFINVEALKAGKGKIFTLIDTGNTIDQTMEQAVRSLNLTSYINNADVINLSRFVLEDAVLPVGLSKEEALQKVQKSLNEIFFDNKTKINSMSNEEFTIISNYVLKQHCIIPSDTQGNLFKAKQSADNSLNKLLEMLFSDAKVKMTGIQDDMWSAIELDKKAADAAAKANLRKSILVATDVGKEQFAHWAKYNMMQKSQEKKNLRLLSPIERRKIRRSESAPAKNSVEALTYKYKQRSQNIEGLEEGLFGKFVG